MGDWVQPNETEWHSAWVKAELPINTQSVTVRMRGSPGTADKFQAWIDLASLHVYYYATNIDSTYGNLTLGASIYYSNAILHPEWDGFVSLAASAGAKVADYHALSRVHSVELKVELLPNNGDATTQAGRLVILYADQTNNEDADLDPEATEEFVNSMQAIGEWSLKGLLLAASIGATLSGAGELAWLILPISGGTWAAFHPFRTPLNLHDPLAEGDADYYAKVNWNLEQEGQYNIKWIEGQYFFDWRFRTVSDDVFAIKITATAKYAHLAGIPPHFVIDATRSASIVIVIASY